MKSDKHANIHLIFAQKFIEIVKSNRVIKSVKFAELKNKGKTIFKVEFDSTDGGCLKKTTSIRTQMWDEDQTLFLKTGLSLLTPNLYHSR